MVTQLQPDVRAYLHGGEVIKRYIRVEEVAHEYGFSVEETEYIAKAASSLYKLTRIHLVKKERFDEFMKHIYKVPGTNKQIIKKFARIGEASIIYSIGRHRFIELARAAGATYKINEGTGGTVLVNLEIFDNYMEQFRQPVRPLKEPLYGQEEGELNARIREPEKEETQKRDRIQEMPEFSVTVTPYEREGSNIKGLARIYFENSFIVNNINIVQGKEKIFVSMPSYKTKQVDEQGKPIYQDVCYPVTKDFREKLYNEIISEYEKAKDKSNENARESAEKHHGNPDKEKDKEATPFR